MLAVSLVFGSFLIILFLIVGLIGGWVAREYMMNYREFPKMHPEFFDNQGNIISDEIVSFKVEPGFYSDFIEDYEESLEDDEDEDKNQ